MGAKKTVKVKNIIIGEGTPKICVPLVAEDALSLKKILAAIKGTGFDLLELRADYLHGLSSSGLGEIAGAARMVRESFPDTPLIFTVRTAHEGGLFKGDYQEYETILLEMAESGLIDLADVELYRLGERADVLVETLQHLGVKVIGSCHFFDRTPQIDEMTGLLTRMQELEADITKLAVMPGCREDVMRLLTAAVLMDEKYADRPCITMSMGAVGQISRILGSFTGSAVTFASVGRESAPGQLSVDKVREAMKIL